MKALIVALLAWNSLVAAFPGGNDNQYNNNNWKQDKKETKCETKYVTHTQVITKPVSIVETKTIHIPVTKVDFEHRVDKTTFFKTEVKTEQRKTQIVKTFPVTTVVFVTKTIEQEVPFFITKVESQVKEIPTKFPVTKVVTKEKEELQTRVSNQLSTQTEVKTATECKVYKWDYQHNNWQKDY
jgi:hypothetical protein